jgi:5-methylcytosine-specific restriction endonuclease McrA
MCLSPNWHVIDLTIDHIIPAGVGGKTEMWNLRTLCRSCHISHHQRTHTAVLALRPKQE